MAKKKKKAAKKKHVKKKRSNEAKSTRVNKKAGAKTLENWLWKLDKPISRREGPKNPKAKQEK